MNRVVGHENRQKTLFRVPEGEANSWEGLLVAGDIGGRCSLLEEVPHALMLGNKAKCADLCV